LVEKAKAIGTVLGVPLALFTVISNIVAQPLIALVVALAMAILVSVLVVRSHWAGITEVIIAWLSLIVITLAGFVIWPKTMMVEGVIWDPAGNSVSHEKVVLFDYSGRRYETTTNAEGYYQFKDVPTGAYRVQVRDTEVAGQTTGILVRVEKQNITVPAFTPTPGPASTPNSTIGSVIVQSACPPSPTNTTSIRIRGVAKACGCRASDFYIIQVDHRLVKVTGQWLNKQPNTKLWAFLVEENGAVLNARPVNPETPGEADWNTYLTVPIEADRIGKVFIVSLRVLEEEDAPPAPPDILPDLGQGQPYQEVFIERVEVIEDTGSICSRAL
jgi:hypothetical protein